MCRLAYLVLILFILGSNAVADCESCVYEASDISVDENGTAIFSLPSSEIRVRYDASTDNLTVFSGDHHSPCSIDIGIVTNIYLASSGPYAAIEGQSGNARFLQRMELDTCQEIGQSIEIGEEGLIEGQSLIIPPICDCKDYDKTECLCSAASVYRVSSSCDFEKDRSASDKLTEARTNLVFEGRRTVAFPGTENASLIEEEDAP